MICLAKMNNPQSNRYSKRAVGFTLLETVVVLGLVSMLIGWVVVSVSTVETEDRLRRASSDIESLAKRARNIAIRQQRAYKLTISEGNIAMAPVYSLSNGEEIEDREDDDEERENFEDITATEETDPEVKYEIKRWRSDVWQVIEGDEKVVITLDPVGLVEPISIRCSVGKSWLIQELHPLTAGVRDEEMSIEKE